MYTGRGPTTLGQSLIASVLLFAYSLFQEEGCDLLACSGRASGDLQLKFQDHEGDHHGRSHSKLLAPKFPSASFKSQKPLASLAKVSKKDVLMKHVLFLRRQRNLCGHIWRWLLLPNTASQRARNS